MMKTYRHIPLDFQRLPPWQQVEESRQFLKRIATRRSVRFFSPKPVPLELIENAIRCAALAPSGANQQPWRFVVVQDPEIKQKSARLRKPKSVRATNTGCPRTGSKRWRLWVRTGTRNSSKRRHT